MELDLRDSPWNEGMTVSAEILDRDVYRLVTLFHASERLANTPERVTKLRDMYQESEVCRLLLTIAVTARNNMDGNPSRTAYWFDDEDDTVGVLVKDLACSENIQKLSFREACNKIIHCDRINFDYIEEKPRMGDSLRPQVYLYGLLSQKNWKATLEIDKFSNMALLIT
jgi:hypothetical protein